MCEKQKHSISATSKNRHKVIKMQNVKKYVQGLCVQEKPQSLIARRKSCLSFTGLIIPIKRFLFSCQFIDFYSAAYLSNNGNFTSIFQVCFIHVLILFKQI